MNQQESLSVKYIHPVPDLCHGNLMWEGKRFPMRGGKFPKDHPIEGARMIVFSSDYSKDETKFSTMVELGYFFSCFPEGDGVVIDPVRDQTPEQVKADIEKVFGFNVEITKK